ncbi:hypothetical protein Hanom_Chr04g00308171 [Helianthus anomalus]
MHETNFFINSVKILKSVSKILDIRNRVIRSRTPLYQEAISHQKQELKNIKKIIIYLALLAREKGTDFLEIRVLGFVIMLLSPSFGAFGVSRCRVWG